MRIIAEPIPLIINPITDIAFKFVQSINTGRTPKNTRNNKMIMIVDIAQYFILDMTFFLFS